jgi:hypothetical protein
VESKTTSSRRSEPGTDNCAVFGSGYTWGAVRTAIVHMAAEVAAFLPVQAVKDSLI